MRLVKVGLFGTKNISATSIAKKVLKKENTHSYRDIINSFNFAEPVRQQLFQFVIKLSYNMSAKVLKNQLVLLRSLSLDDQLKIVNKTIQQGWGSLIPAYELFVKNRCDNMQKQSSIQKKFSNSLSVVDETF